MKIILVWEPASKPRGSIIKGTGAFSLGFLLLLSVSACALSVGPYVDFWTNGQYLSTNGEKTNFNSMNIRSEGKFGLNFESLLPGINFIPYVAYYGVTSSNDPNYWNNNAACGGGIRIMPFTAASPEGWHDEWVRDIKFFYESLSLSFLKDAATATANNVKTQDYRFGLDLWHEWNLNKDLNKRLPWNEMWLNASYRDTDFAAAVNFNYFRTYLIYLQNRMGLHLGGGLRPYVVTYLTTAGRDEEWYNSLYYGLGARMEPFLEMEEPPEILRKFKMFIEVLGISWLKGNTTGRPTQDIRFGIDFTYGR